MIRSHETLGKPIQPQGWPLAAHTNLAIQARQEAERERRRVEQLTRRCRRLRSVAAWALVCTAIGMGASFGLGGILGFAIGSGLLGMGTR